MHFSRACCSCHIMDKIPYTVRIKCTFVILLQNPNMSSAEEAKSRCNLSLSAKRLQFHPSDVPCNHCVLLIHPPTYPTPLFPVAECLALPIPQNVLWPEDIQCPMVVGLAGMDKIVPAKPLRRFLLSHPSFLPGAAGSTHDANGNTLCNGQSNGMSTSKSSGQPTGATPRRGSRRRSVGDMHRNEARKQLPPSCVQEDCTSNRRSTKISSSDGSKSGNEQPQMDQRTDDLAYSKASHLDKGVRHAKTVAVAATNGADGSVNSVDGGLINCVGQAVAKRVELVYWSELGHGWALGDVRRLDEFVEVLRRQDECFVDR